MTKHPVPARYSVTKLGLALAGQPVEFEVHVIGIL